MTSEHSWAETGPLPGTIAFDASKGDRRGPLSMGWALVREVDAAEAVLEEPVEQRVLVIGDGDFLSNTYLGNGGNLDLGLRMVNWLVQDDSLISIRATTAPDTALSLSPTASLLIGLGLLLVLPLLLLGCGLLIWLRRRRQ